MTHQHRRNPHEGRRPTPVRKPRRIPTWGRTLVQEGTNDAKRRRVDDNIKCSSSVVVVGMMTAPERVLGKLASDESSDQGEDDNKWHHLAEECGLLSVRS